MGFKRKKALLSLVILISISKFSFSQFKELIPPDFDPKNTVLLVGLLNENVANNADRKKFHRWNEEMKSYMAEKYPYKYEFIPMNDSAAGIKFSDRNTYRFGLFIKTARYFYTVKGSNPPRSWSGNETYDFYFIDQLNEKEYPSTNRRSATPLNIFKKVINTIMEER